MVESSGLLNRRRGLNLYRGFESLPLRHVSLKELTASSIRFSALINDGAPEPGEQDFTRRVHILLSAMWGVGLLFGMLISLAIIFSLSVDVGKGVNTVVSLALTGLLILATAVVARMARSRREQSAAALS